jgi:hypothetical protein
MHCSNYYAKRIPWLCPCPCRAPVPVMTLSCPCPCPVCVSVSVRFRVPVCIPFHVPISVNFYTAAMTIYVRHGNYLVDSQGLCEVARKLKGPSHKRGWVK